MRISTRPQRFCKPPEVCSDFYHEYKEVFDHFEDFNLDEHIIVSGCYETNRHTIQKQIDCKNFSGGRLPVYGDYEQLKSSIRDSIRKLQIEEVGEVNVSDLYDFDFDLDTKPGYRYEHYFNAQKKVDCADIAIKVAEQRYNKIIEASRDNRVIKREEIIPGIYTIGARNTRKTLCEPGEDLTSRAVHMPEWHTELHSGLFSDLITALLVERGSGPIFIGNSFIKCERFNEQLNKNFCAIEGDWSKFDASLCNILVTMAVCICRLYFPSTRVYDNHFLAVLDSLVIKDYHVVGGNVLRILHGLPSGSKWTSLIGSIINLIILNYSFSDIKYYDRSFAIGGDDFVAFIKTNKYNMDEIKEKVVYKASSIGMEFKYYKEKFFKNSNKVEDYPVFYKYTVFEGKPVIPVESILERVFSPWNRVYKTNFDVIKFLDDLLPSLAYPSSSCLLYYQFYKYCYFRSCGVSINVKDLIKRHYLIYRRMMLNGVNYLEIKDDVNFTKRNVFINNVKVSKYVRDVFMY